MSKSDSGPILMASNETPQAGCSETKAELSGRHASSGAEAESSSQFHQPAPAEAGQDDITAALMAMTPAEMNMDLMLDHLTTSSDLFGSPHLDLSSLESHAVEGESG